MFHTHFWLFICGYVRVCECLYSFSLSPSFCVYVCMCICNMYLCVSAHMSMWERKKNEATDSETHSRRKRDGKRKLFCAFTYHYYGMYLYMVSEFACMLVCVCDIAPILLSVSFVRSLPLKHVYIVVVLLVIRFSIKNNISSIYFMCSVQTHQILVTYVRCVMPYAFSV